MVYAIERDMNLFLPTLQVLVMGWVNQVIYKLYLLNLLQISNILQTRLTQLVGKIIEELSKSR